jgi:protein-L-isoaspartate(D-aspartate) O-methyltransferase
MLDLSNNFKYLKARLMNTDIARQKMIEQQVRAWDVFDPDVLEVLSKVPREQFVPFGYEILAFADTEIPIGRGQSMMTPTVEGRVLQALDLDGTEKVLEIGSGNGFLTACLSRLAEQVTSLEIFEDLKKRAADNLADAGIDNVELLSMDATQELPDGKFDAIVVTGSLQTHDPRLVEALEVDGRLFVVIGDAPVMDALIVRKTGENAWASETLFETELTPLINGALPPQFIF